MADYPFMSDEEQELSDAGAIIDAAESLQNGRYEDARGYLEEYGYKQLECIVNDAELDASVINADAAAKLKNIYEEIRDQIRRKWGPIR